MANSPFDSNPAFAKMSDEARKSVTQAFDAMSSWRDQMSEMGEKNSEAVFDKMAEAAKALGWPTEFVEMSRKQVQTASKMQTQMIGQVMETWQQQMTNPGSAIKMPSFNGPGFQMPTFPGFPAFPSASTGGSPFPGFGDMSAMGGNPMQMWMQAAEMWQKNWQQALGSWVEAQSSMMSPGGAGKSSPTKPTSR